MLRAVFSASIAATVLSIATIAYSQPRYPYNRGRRAQTADYGAAGGVRITLDPHGYTSGPAFDQAVGGAQWRQLCVAPCTITVDPQGTYRVRGGLETYTYESVDNDGHDNGAVTGSYNPLTSAPFRIFSSPSAQTLRVDGAGSHSADWVVTSVGGAFLVVGVLGWAGVFGAGTDSSDARLAIRLGCGGGGTVFGAVFLPLGIYGLMRVTTVRDDSGRRLAKDKPRGFELTPTGFVF